MTWFVQVEGGRAEASHAHASTRKGKKPARHTALIPLVCHLPLTSAPKPAQLRTPPRGWCRRLDARPMARLQEEKLCDYAPVALARSSAIRHTCQFKNEIGSSSCGNVYLGSHGHLPQRDVYNCRHLQLPPCGQANGLKWK